MSENKKVAEKYMEGFSSSDHAKILSCLTDDVVWDIPGYVYLKGKEQFDKEIITIKINIHPSDLACVRKEK